MSTAKSALMFEGLQIVTLCMVWYGEFPVSLSRMDVPLCDAGVSAIGNVIVKELLNEFPFPLTVTLAQIFSVWMLSIPLLWYVLGEPYVCRSDRPIV